MTFRERREARLQAKAQKKWDEYLIRKAVGDLEFDRRLDRCARCNKERRYHGDGFSACTRFLPKEAS